MKKSCIWIERWPTNGEYIRLESSLISSEHHELPKRVSNRFMLPKANRENPTARTLHPKEPRWGRNIETPGEDPYLTGAYAENFVRGFSASQFKEECWISGTFWRGLLRNLADVCPLV